MLMNEIPLIAGPQILSITLGGTLYSLRLTWCFIAGTWVLDISNAQTTEVLIQGIPLVTGVDLLGQYAYLGIGGSLYVISDIQASALPTFTNLGQQSHLYYITGT